MNEIYAQIASERKAKAPARIAQVQKQIALLKEVARQYYKANNTVILAKVHTAQAKAQGRLREYTWDLKG